jgi:hypothetical protein
MLFPQYPYLYSCSECGRKIKIDKHTHEVKRSCSHNYATINAPRKSILTGDGTLNRLALRMRWEWALRCWLTRLTGRSI